MPVMFRRRALLARSTGLVAAGLVLQAGSCMVNKPTPSAIQQDADTLDAGVAGLLAEVQAAGVSIAPNTLTAINAAIADIDKNAQAIAAALTPSGSVIQTIQADVTTLGTLLAPFFPVAPLVASGVSAAGTLVATMLQEAGVPTPHVAEPMSAARARAILKALATAR